MAQAPLFERMLVDSGISLTKFWFSVTQSEQRTRFIIRQVDPVRQWKLSPIDLESLDKWDDYTAAKEAMIRRTDTEWAPWTTMKSNDKKRARINAMRAFLARFDYDGKDADIVGEPDPPHRPARHRRGGRLTRLSSTRISRRRGVRPRWYDRRESTPESRLGSELRRSPMAHPDTLTRLVGRDREMATLDAFVGKAAADGATLLLTGEPGVGKTALLVAAAEMAARGGDPDHPGRRCRVRDRRELRGAAPAGRSACPTTCGSSPGPRASRSRWRSASGPGPHRTGSRC